MTKKYIKVLAVFEENGEIRPKEVQWEDGRRFVVDYVTDVRFAASTKVGGQGMRYTCVIGGNQVYLYRDRSRWFVEAK